MRLSRLLVLIVTLLTFSNTKLFSQIKNYPFAIVVSNDSLQGFSDGEVKSIALKENIFGEAYNYLLETAKRAYVNKKYKLFNPYELNTGSGSGNSVSKIIGTGNVINAAPCVNEGFESGTIAGWVGRSGLNNLSNGSCTPAITSGSSPTLQVVNLPFNDPIIGSIGFSPFSGNKALKINDQLAVYGVSRITQTFVVTNTNFLYEFAYQAIMSTQHICCQQTYMQVRLFNLGSPQTCPSFTFAPPPPSGPTCASPSIPWSFTTVPGFNVAYNPSWQKYSMDLTSFMSSTVSIEVTVADCSQGGHWGYSYFDSNCSEVGFLVNGTTFVSAPTTTVNLQGNCAQTATVMAPGGLGPYTWTGPTGTSTNQTLFTNVPGTYTISMSPPGSCIAIQRVIFLSFPPATTLTASPANLCATGTNTSSTLTAVGASNYTWAPGGSTLSTIVVSPTTTTIYTVTANTGTCIGTYTVQVTVNLDPLINVVSSNFSVCPGQSATLTAFGANSYVWNPGALSGSVVVVSPTVSTTYTTIGTSTAGCTGSAVTNINTSPAISLTLSPLSPTYNCSGTPVNIVAGGATTFTWLPGNLNNFFVTLSPTITTNYTVIGASGACSNSANITLSVNPGPNITLSANPVSTCPGNTTTLSALAPSAVGAFTWNPGAINASSIVVTPTLAGGYSVSAKDAMGCVNTQTINPTLSPQPTVVISPSPASVCIGSSVTLTATGALNYTWMPGGLTGATAVLSPTSNTTYTVTGANAAGCTNQTLVSVTVVPIPTINASASPTAVCAGSCATITPGGASSYTISGGAFVVCPTSNTVYSIVGSSAAGCVSSPINVSVNVNPAPTISASSNPTAICPAGSSTLTAGGGVSYTWQPGGMNGSPVSVSPTITTVYTLTGASAFGCTATANTTVVVNTVPVVSVSPSSTTICQGASVNLTASGATTYTWLPGNLSGSSVVVSPTINTTYTVLGANGSCSGQNTVVVTVAPIPVISGTFLPGTICAGSCATLSASGGVSYTTIGLTNPGCPTITTNYTVIGTSASGCTNSATGTLFVNPAPIIGASSSPTAICPGGTSSLTASGGTSYTWQPGGMNGSPVSVNPVTTTVYTVTGASALGCTATANTTVVVNPVPVVSVSPSSTTICNGSSVNLTASGASTYTWQPGNLSGSSVTVSPVGNTIYTVTGTNGSCSGQNTVVVTVAPIPVISGTFLPGTICVGSCATLSASGGVSYTTVGLTNPGCPTITTNYTVIGTSASGCTNSATGTLFVNPAPIIGASSSPTAICPGGTSSLTASGGTSYTWQPGGMNGSPVSVNPVTTTVYTVTGASALGCTATANTTVVVNPVPVVSVSPSSTTICNGSSVNLTASGASTYTWQPGNLSGSSVTVSPIGNTIYTVTGANGSCSGQNTVAVTIAPNPTVNASFTPTTICAGSCATLTPSGALTYTTTGLSTIACPTITSSYTVVGTNALGCISAPFVGSLPVIAAPNILATANPTGICAGDSSFVSASGGVSYTWQPGGVVATSFFAKPSTSTLYTVTGTSAAGCTRATTVNVVVFPSPTVFAFATPTTICAGASATLSGGGATSLFWSPGGLSGSIVFVSPTVTTTYTLTGTSGACTGSTTVTVFVNPTPTITINPSVASICPGGSTTFTVSGASTYTWADGSNSATRSVSPSVTTTYSVLATGVGACLSNVASITVSVTTAPTLNASATPSNICIGGSSTLTASGALTYTWQPGNLNGSLVIVTPTVSTTYTVSGTGAGGCSGISTVFVLVSPGISVSASASPSLLCGTVTTTLTATGATNYTWMPGSLTGSMVTAIVVGNTVYTVTGTNGGCTAQATVAVNFVPTPSINISASSNSICGGGCATLTASGASSYIWNTGSFGSPIVVCPTVTTTYSVIGSVGTCTNLATITIFVSGNPTVAIQSSANPICAGSTAILTASGASNYLWSTTSTQTTISVAPSTSSVYTLFGSIGTCTSSTTFTLNVIPATPITINASTTSVCAGFTVGLLASGSASSYTWQPNNVSINPLIDTPLTSTIYTVSSDNGGCISTATIGISVIPLPLLNATANPPTICTGNTTTLTATGANSYTWIPGFSTGSTFIDSPSTTTTYTVVGLAASGCPNYTTITVNVVPGITVTPIASNNPVCIGSSATLTATGATNYTWQPGSQTGNVIVINPASSTTYTVIGSNGGSCFGSALITINVSPNPTINAIASPTFVCIGGTVSLVASGAANYTWIPNGLIGSSVVDTPLSSTNYTVFGVDANGCSNIGTVSVTVNSMSNIILAANPSSLCLGGSSTLTASGGLSYTWNPGAQVTNSLVVTPLATTIYTILANDASGCTGTFSLPVTVFPTPTVNVSPLNFSVCIGSSVTLSASGANSYTWLPSGSNSSSITESPTVFTTYTVIGDNGGLCFSTTTVNVFVNQLPKGVAAASHGTVGCTSPTAQLVGTCTDTNVSYSWAGPLSYSSSIQSPTISGIWGNFTLSVTDNVTGCVASATVDVATDNTIPLVTPVASGSIGCAITTVTLNAVNTTTNPSYSWSGPSGFTSTIQNPIVSQSGTYTIVVTDLSSTCSGSAVVTVGTHTTVSVTASISPSSCDSTGVSKNDGSISVFGFTLTDKYDLVSGTSYTGSATYLTAANIPTNGIIASNLSNPSVALAFTIRLFDLEGCTKDTTLYLIPVDCAFRTFGIAKAVSDPELNTDGSYNLTYTVVAKSYDNGVLTNISLTENLSNTFPAPATFTVIADSLRTIAGAILDLNMSFDGSSQTNLLTSSGTNSLLSKDSTVIQFKIRVRPTLFITTDYKNSVVGEALTAENVTMIDSSHTGLDPNPDGDRSPYNNNVPTGVNFFPKMAFGLTKTGEIHKSDGDGFDITYTISVHNLGNDTLFNINLKDSLFNNTIKNPATYSMKSGPAASGSGLVVNSLYNGNSNSYLLDSAQSKVPPNSVRSVYFTINVNPGEITSISNSAYGSAHAITKEVNLLSDSSNAGTNPDVNGNGIWNEPSDNMPTVLLIPNTHTLFIPEGFSPDGDNINQFFVIQGLPTTGNNPITIFNRWGNKVYSSPNYDNTWDGTPNVSGTLGKNKLPQGTYYYILEMKDSGQKPITGFVVLQY